MSDMMKKHPDAPQDDLQIRYTLAKLIVPVLMKLEGKFQELNKKVEDVNSVVNKMIMGFNDALTGQEKKALMEELNSLYGPDIEGMKGLYSDLYEGRDYMEDLLEEVLKVPGEGRMDFAKTVLGKSKEKYGKYMNPSKEEIKEEPAEPVSGVEVEITEGPVETEEGGEDLVGSLMKRLRK